VGPELSRCAHIQEETARRGSHRKFQAFSRTKAWAIETKNKQNYVQGRYLRQAADTPRRVALMQFSHFSVVLTEHYRRLAADFFCLGYYFRYTMMAARER
jgi:hypothetical protein